MFPHLGDVPMTPPFVLDLLESRESKSPPPPRVLVGLTKCSDVRRGEFPMVQHGECDLIDGDSMVDMMLYEQGPGTKFGSSCLLGAIGQEPCIEFDGESSPKYDVRPAVEHLLGLVKREKRVEVKSPPRSSSHMGLRSTVIEEASAGEDPRLRPCFLRGGGA